MKINELISEGKNYPVIAVDVQPAYSTSRTKSTLSKIIHFVVNQTGPVLMFVNADETGITEDSIPGIQEYWCESIGYTYDDETDEYNCPINWGRFTFNDKGYGYLRSWMDRGVPESIIIKTIRLMYQQGVYDSRDLTIDENPETRPPELNDIYETIQEMEDASISVGWTSVAQLKKFSGAYIVGGGRNECLREVELLMNAFNIKYKRINSLVYG